MKKIMFRMGIVIAISVIGILLVGGLTFMGNKSSGPVEDFFVKVGSGISTLENKFILNKREKTRSKSLSWFNEYRSDRKKMANPDKFLFGAYDNEVSETFQSIVALEDSLQMVFPLVQVYTAWGSKPEQRFPMAEAKAILDIGSMPVITWEPWLTDFDKEKMPGIPDTDKRDKDGLKAIANGVYDTYIDKWAGEAKSLNKLVFVRFGHEMNDPYRYPWGPQNNKPEDFIAAWKHVVDRFKKIGAENVIWVWSPHPAYTHFDEYYPGDAYVDWIGLGILNYGTVATWSQWWTFDEIFGKYYEELAKYKKPMMISEFGSLAVGGDRPKWYQDALTDLPIKYPAVKALIFFHCSVDNTTTYQTLRWYIKDDPGVTKSVINATGNWPVNYLPKPE
jgi:hypothetical protein